MQVTQVSVKQIKNLGNYQKSTVELTAIVNQDDDPQQVLKFLQNQINVFLFPKPENEGSEEDLPW